MSANHTDEFSDDALGQHLRKIGVRSVLQRSTATEDLPTLHDDGVFRVQHLHVTAATVDLNTGDSPTRLYGIGPSADLLDANDAIAKLLSADLDALERAIPLQSWLSWGPAQPLQFALEFVMDSEAHQMVFEKRGPSSPAYQLPPQYTDRLRQLVRRALWRVFTVPLLLVNVLAGIVGIVTLPFFISAVDSMGVMGLLVPNIAVPIVIIGVSLVGERLVLQQLGVKRFDPIEWPRIARVLKRQRIGLLFRIAALVAVVAWFFVVFLG